ncbi:Hypothetical predicted protein [Octopus vulgaris]|uniref:Uncharacterized protein n=1 Tax=Octopus vulgaris TaxID=6645 RepID=A0AA36B431_OCTVU|nr:Hypothetical predicted protein [Octopus vulgaris]
MDRNNTRYSYSSLQNRKETYPQYQVSNMSFYTNTANSSRYNSQNSNWQPHYLQKYRATSWNRNANGQSSHRLCNQQHNLHLSYPKFVNSNYKFQAYRNPYQLRNLKQPWLSQPASTASNSMIHATVNHVDTSEQGTPGHSLASYQSVGNISRNNQRLISVDQQDEILQDPAVTTSDITETSGNHEQDRHSLSKLNSHDGRLDESGNIERKADVNKIQSDTKYKIEEGDPKSESNQVKWKMYKVKYGNELKIKPTIRFKSIVDKIRDNTCNLKHVYLEEFHFKDNHDKKETCELEYIHNETKWKLYKLEHGNELKIKPNLTEMNTSDSYKKMSKILPNLSKKYLTTFRRPVIENLYFGKQCSICGERRFSNMNDHMDGHFRENTVTKHKKYPKCRQWYIQEDYGDGDNPFQSLLEKHQNMKTEQSKSLKYSSENDVSVLSTNVIALLIIDMCCD